MTLLSIFVLDTVQHGETLNAPVFWTFSLILSSSVFLFMVVRAGSVQDDRSQVHHSSGSFYKAETQGNISGLVFFFFFSPCSVAAIYIHVYITFMLAPPTVSLCTLFTFSASVLVVPACTDWKSNSVFLLTIMLLTKIFKSAFTRVHF